MAAETIAAVAAATVGTVVSSDTVVAAESAVDFDRRRSVADSEDRLPFAVGATVVSAVQGTAGVQLLVPEDLLVLRR